MRRKVVATALIALAGTLACALAGGMLAAKSMRDAAAVCAPSPDAPAAATGDGFPEVDWGYWREVNPDVVGWVTVPGTPIDYPVAQAPASDPGYYLDHDVYGDWNYAGCPYLDAACAEDGLLGSRNAVVSGHNLGGGDEALFASFARFTDPGFAAEHAEILVQTPEAKRVMKVVGAARIEGGEPIKRTEFSSAGDWRAYVERRLAECAVALDEAAAGAGSMMTFCTCSYALWSDDERTLVYAVSG